MDMIDIIELEDSIKHFERVKNRVEEVALTVARIMGELDGKTDRKWRFESFYMRPSSPSEPWREITEVSVTLKVDWDDRPVTKKFGDPEYDEESDYSTPDYMSRVVTFPRRFLTTDGWEHEVHKRANRAARARYPGHISRIETSISETKKKLVEMENSLTEHIKKFEDLGGPLDD